MSDSKYPNTNTNKSSSLLPNFYRTDANKKILQATIEQLTQSGTVTKVNGYIGRQNAKAATGNDVFISAADQTRQNYQLEPGLVVTDELDNTTFFKDYQDYINQIDVFGGDVKNHARLNKQEFYSWDPHIDWDKFVNFQNYYWLPYGPDIIHIYGHEKINVSTYTVTLETELNTNAYLFTPNGLTPNPTIKLYRGQKYIFDITSPGNPFSIKTLRVTGSEYRYKSSKLTVKYDNTTNEPIEITFTVPEDAPDILYYVSETNLDFSGVIEIYDFNANSYINVETELLGKQTYTLPNGVPLSNGMKVSFVGDVTPVKYATGHYYVEGVGTSITLVNENILEVVGSYTESFAVLFDDTPFDKQPFSDATSFAGTSEYITINRGSLDYNPWSRYNRWFHKSVIEVSATINGKVAEIDQSARAVRPIIEFEANIKLFNFGTSAIQDVELIDNFTTDVFSMIEGQFGYNIDRQTVVSGQRILFTADPDIRVKDKIFKVQFVDVLHDNSGSRQIHLELDSEPTENDVVLVKQGHTNQGLTYWYDGSNWNATQKKLKLNQPPLFDVVDENTISYGDLSVYNGSTFVGTPLFSYKIGTGTNDSNLGFPLSYKNIDNIGDIVFNFNLTNQTFSYYDSTTIVTGNINVGYLVRTIKNKTQQFINGWQISNARNTQAAVRIYKDSNLTNDFDLDIFNDKNDLSDLEVRTYINGIRLDKFNNTIHSVYNVVVDPADVLKVTFTIPSQVLPPVVGSYYRVISTNESYNGIFQVYDSTTTSITLGYTSASEGYNPADTTSVTLANWTVIDGRYYKKLVLNTDVNLTDIVTIKAYSKQPINSNGYYEIPINLQNNTFNDLLGDFTLGEVIDHVSSIIDNLSDTFIGSYPGPSNIRDLGNVTQYGTKFVQHSGPLSLSLYHITSSSNNIIRSIEKSRTDYNKFKRTFLTTAETLGVDTNTVSQVDLILQRINADKPTSYPYYFSDMVPCGANVTNNFTVIDYRIKTYPLSTIFDPTVCSNKAVLIYLNNIQLLKGHDYSFDSQGFVVVKATINNDDIITIREYDNTNGSFIPATPSKLGLYPTFDPKIYMDISLINPVMVIQGHDGSQIAAYGDFRDDLILELEKRIYNNIKVPYDPSIFDIYDIIPGYNRETDYSLEEFNQVLAPNFYKWTALIAKDFTTPINYDRANSITYNYKRCVSPDGKSVPGYWKGIFRWMLDTDRPNITPWEMLGFNDQPVWWESVYGPAPYTSDNLILWQDLTDGIVREPGKPAFKMQKFVRPFLINHVPVDEQGSIVSPLYSGMATGVIGVETADDFVFGDVGPVESAWRRSSYYPFSLLITSMLLHPAKTFGSLLDRSRIVRNYAGQLIYKGTNLRIKPNDVLLPSIYSDTTDIKTSGIINYIVDYVLNGNLSQYTSYKYDLANITSKLSYRIGGFTSKEKFNLLLDSKTPKSAGSVFVPQENYKVVLNSSSPIKRITYSGVIITKTPDGFDVSGYSRTRPYFKYYPYIQSGNTINVGGISESYMIWTSNQYYSDGKIVSYNKKYYRVIVPHTSIEAFNSSNFVVLPALPIIGGRTAILRSSWDRENPIVVPYRTKFTTIQDVVDFLLGYGEWLKDQGFVFDDFIPSLNAVTNWVTSSKEFLFWTTQNWSSGEDKWQEWLPNTMIPFNTIVRYNGEFYQAIRKSDPSLDFLVDNYIKLDGLSTVGSSVISLSPAAHKLTFATPLSVVDDIRNTFNEYEMVDVNGVAIEPKFLNNYREENLVSYSPRDEISIYGATFYLIQKEQIVILDNSTMFNDTIYNSESGYRQERVKVSGYVNTDWNGSFNVPGFIFDQANINDWKQWQDYALGDIVKYKEFYYSASKFLPGVESFNSSEWIKLDKKPVPQLLPNWTYKATQFTDFYSLDSDNFDLSQQEVAQHLVGYQKRQYLDNIIQDDVSEYKFYQGMIRDKGTQNVLNKLFDVLSAENLESVTFYEEWAIRLGQYGANAAFNNIEFILNEADFKNNPQGLELVDVIDTTKTDVVIRQTPTDVYLKPLGYTSMVWPPVTKNVPYLRSAGYVREDEVNLVLKTIDEILTYDITQFNEGDYIWCGFEKHEWNVYRICNTKLRVDDVTYEEGQLSIIVPFNVTLTSGTYIGISQVTGFNGFYKVSQVNAIQSTMIYTESGAQSAILTAINVALTSTITINLATVTISTGFIPSQDTLEFVNDELTMSNITGEYDPVTGIMTLISTNEIATVQNWYNALSAVTYSNNTINISSRSLSYSTSTVDELGETVTHSSESTITMTLINRNAIMIDTTISTWAGNFTEQDNIIVFELKTHRIDSIDNADSIIPVNIKENELIWTDNAGNDKWATWKYAPTYATSQFNNTVDDDYFGRNVLINDTGTVAVISRSSGNIDVYDRKSLQSVWVKRQIINPVFIGHYEENVNLNPKILTGDVMAISLDSRWLAIGSPFANKAASGYRSTWSSSQLYSSNQVVLNSGQYYQQIPLSVIATISTNNSLILSMPCTPLPLGFAVNTNLHFNGAMIGGISAGITYYVKTINTYSTVDINTVSQIGHEVTIVTQAAHGYTTGQYVSVTGTSLVDQYNVVITVIDTTTFTYNSHASKSVVLTTVTGTVGQSPDITVSLTSGGAVVAVTSKTGSMKITSNAQVITVDTATDSGDFFSATGTIVPALISGMMIKFTGTVFGGVVAGTTYYVKDILSPTTFTISSTIVNGVVGSIFPLSAGSGSLTAIATYGRNSVVTNAALWNTISYIPVDESQTNSELTAQGAISIYEKDSNNIYALVDTILSPIPTTNERFGSNLLFGNDILFVTAEGHDSNTHSRVGQVYKLMYGDISQITVNYNPAGSKGTTLVVSNTTGIEKGMQIIGTGFSDNQTVIEIVDLTTLVVSKGPTTTPAGSLKFTSKGWGYYSSLIVNQGQQNVISLPTSSDATDSKFGYSMSISQDNSVLAISANSSNSLPGKVFLYKSTDGYLTPILSTPLQDTNIVFGKSTSISDTGEYIAISSIASDEIHIDQGTVYVYKRASTNSYVLYQELVNNRAEEAELFGNKVSFMNDSSTIVVYNQNAESYINILFDTGSTTFDKKSTMIVELNHGQGRVDIYDRYNTKWIYSESLINYSEVQSTQSKYGTSMSVGSDIILVSAIGAPNPLNELYLGVVYEYTKSKNTYAWSKLHQEITKPDIKKIKQAFLYNKSNNKLVSYVDIIDIAQGKIAGIADQEIKYKTFYDPATYSVGNEIVNVDDGMAWTTKQVGTVWWDLRAAKFLNSYDDDIVYRNSSWNTLFPGASIDVYEWVESSLLPTEWDIQADTDEGIALGISGTTLYGDSAYSIFRKYDNVSKTFKNTYYYWVKNKKTIPNVPNRNIAIQDITNLILNPRGQSYTHIALTGLNSVSLFNVKPLLDDKNVVLSVEYWMIDKLDQNIHSQWKLISNDNKSSIPKVVEQKWFDSLCGKDLNDRVVPDLSLPLKLRYGIESKPRQGMFVNRLEALKQIIEQANRVLIVNQIQELKDLSTLETYDKEPSVISNLYDEVIDTEAELRFANVDTFVSATVSPIIIDGKIVNVRITNAGYGYGKLNVKSYDEYNAPIDWYGPSITIKGLGLDAIIKSIVNASGQLIGTEIISSGYGYNSETTLEVRKYSVLVHSDSQAANNWSIYSYNELTMLWTRIQTQTYDTRKYWYYVDWYDVGYSSVVAYTYSIDTFAELNSISASIGELVKVRSTNSGNWILLEKYADSISVDWTQSYKVVGLQNGTIQFSSTLYQFEGTVYGYDGALYDIDLYDNSAATELRIILNTLKNNIFTDTLSQEYLNLFFTGVRYALHEQNYIDWIFKTSFVKAQHNVGNLKEKVTYSNDNLADFESYVSEVKPYRTKIREYISSYDKLDTNSISTTDFDLPVVYDNDTSTIKPLVTVVKDGVIQADNNLITTYPWKHWLDNVGFSVIELKIVDGGSNYLNEPTVTFENSSGTGAKARAFVVNGSINRIILLSKGTGYLTAPKVVIDGGPEAVPAKVVAIIGNSLIRSNSIKMKFDRITSTYFVTQLQETEEFTGTGSRLQFSLIWGPNILSGQSIITVDDQPVSQASYKLSIVKQTTRGYTSYSGAITFSSAPLNGSKIVVTYLKDWSLLSAADRIQYYYNPVSGQIGKDLSQLMTGVDYGGVVVTGLNFENGYGWDSVSYQSDKWDSYDETFDDFTIKVDQDTHSFTLPYTPDAGTEINIYYVAAPDYLVSVRLDDNEFDTDEQRLRNPDAIMFPWVADGISRTVYIPSTFIVHTNDKFVLRKSTSDGSLAPQEDNYDMSLIGGDLAYQTATGIAAEEIIIDGDGFVTPISSPATEEVVPGQIVDAVAIKIIDKPAEQYANIKVDRYVADGVTSDFKISQVPNSLDAVVVKVTNMHRDLVTDEVFSLSTIMVQGTDYTFEYRDQMIRFNWAPVAGQNISIFSFGFGGTHILELDHFTGDGSTYEFVTGVKWQTPVTPLVYVDGQPYIVTLYQANYHIGFRFVSPPPIYSLITYVIASGSDQTFSITSAERFNAVNSVTTYDIDSKVGNAIPLETNMIVRVNQTILIGPKNSYFKIENNVLTYAVDIFTVAPGSVTTVDDITVIIDGVALEYNVDYTVILDGIFIKLKSKTYKRYVGKTLCVSITQGQEYTYTPKIANQSATITFVRSYNSTDTIEITSFYKHDILEIHTSNINILSNTIVIPWDPALIRFMYNYSNRIQYLVNDVVEYNNYYYINTTYYTADINNPNNSVVPSTDEHWALYSTRDYYRQKSLASGKLPLDRPVPNDNFVWVIQNGKLLIPSVDFKLNANKNSVSLAKEPNALDKIVLMTFGYNESPNFISYMQFKDMLNRIHYKRLNYNKQTLLVRDLRQNDLTIEVKDASTFDKPTPSKNKPGIVEINGERIEYFTIKGNTLGQLRRGTLGTGTPSIHRVGAYVQDIGPSETIPYVDSSTIDQLVYTAGSAVNLTFTPTKASDVWTYDPNFVSSIPTDSQSGSALVNRYEVLSYISKTGTTTYQVTFMVSTTKTPVVGTLYTVSGNSNTNYNGIHICKSSSSVNPKSITITEADSNTNRFKMANTNVLTVNTPIVFTQPVFGNVTSNAVYYILEIVNSTQFTISETRNGDVFELSTSIGTFMLATIGNYSIITLEYVTDPEVYGTGDTSIKTTTFGQSNDIEVFVGGYDVSATWEPNTQYLIEDIVNVGSYTYRCITNHTSAVTFSKDSTKWKFFIGNIRLKKKPYKVFNVNQHPESPEGDVQFDADFSVDGVTKSIRLTNDLASGIHITVIKRTGSIWDSALTIRNDNTSLANFIKHVPGVWHTNIDKYASNIKIVATFDNSNGSNDSTTITFDQG